VQQDDCAEMHDNADQAYGTKSCPVRFVRNCVTSVMLVSAHLAWHTLLHAKRCLANVKDRNFQVRVTQANCYSCRLLLLQVLESQDCLQPSKDYHDLEFEIN